MLLTRKTVHYRAKSLTAYREKLAKQQSLHGNHFVENENFQRETRPRGEVRTSLSRQAMSDLACTEPFSLPTTQPTPSAIIE